MYMEKLKVAVIGAGQVARTSHINHYQSLNGVEVAAVCDMNQEAARITAEQFGIQAWFDEPARMLDKIRPDAVSVCVPNKFHCDITCLCLEHGCHVLCEKPPAITFKEALRMRDTAVRSGRILTFGFHFRHAEKVGFLKKMIGQGVLGTVYAGEVTWLRRRGIPGWGNFTSKELQGGGPLIDIGAHLLDLAVYLLDYPIVDYVCATTSDRIGRKGGRGFLGDWSGETFGVEDGLFGFIRFTDGSSLQVRTAFAVNIAEKEERNIRLYGDKKGLSLFPLQMYGDEDGFLSNTSFPFDDNRDWHYDCIKNFTMSCMGKEQVLVTPEQAVYVQKLIDALYRSAETGEPEAFRDR